jgi:hypothetical protein
MATMLPYVADYDSKRRILEIMCLNRTLDGATLVPEIRKPFDVFAEGLVSEKSRDDWIRTSDLLNLIQEARRAKCRENAALSRLRAF